MNWELNVVLRKKSTPTKLKHSKKHAKYEKPKKQKHSDVMFSKLWMLHGMKVSEL